MKTGALLVNLGTPDAPTPKAVGRYLREFLSDPHVIDIPTIFRLLLVNLIIVPFRRKKAAEAYEKVWTDRGSPLKFHGEDLVAGVRAALPDVPVELAMRYQSPSIRAALRHLEMEGVRRVIVVPLFPQYAAATTGSVIERVETEAARRKDPLELVFVDSFCDAPEFIEAQAELARRVIAEARPDRVVMSYHGLPERQIQKADTSGKCLAHVGCCDELVARNQRCYRAHCFATSRALARALDLEDGTYDVAFQSRFGRAKWIEPYTETCVLGHAASGVRRLVVLSPAFVADCIETTEELGLRLRADFLAAGGEELVVVPCVNASDRWITGVADLIRLRMGQEPGRV